MHKIDIFRTKRAFNLDLKNQITIHYNQITFLKCFEKRTTIFNSK